LINTKVAVKLIKNVHLEGGVNNLLDKNYTITEGFPEAGRNYFINLAFTYL
jgi:iron complex outermembrane receptor protein